MKKLICKLMRYIADIIDEIMTWCHTSIAAPTLLSATVVPPNIILTWTDNATNNTCYMIWRSTDGTNFTLLETINTADLSTWTDTTAVFGQNYWYKVQACNSDGETSDFSNVVETSHSATEIDYGILYNWYAATGDGGVHNIAPVGWHVPTETDFDDLTTILGGVAVAGGKLVETGLTYWDAPNVCDNSALFYARGSGSRYTGGNFVWLKQFFYIWASTQLSAASGNNRYVGCGSTQINGNNSGIEKWRGCSIRLIKDDSINPGYVVDYDGNIYATVTIGTQVWTLANLIVKHYNDGTLIPEVTDGATWLGLTTGAWCYYNNDSSNM